MFSRHDRVLVGICGFSCNARPVTFVRRGEGGGDSDGGEAESEVGWGVEVEMGVIEGCHLRYETAECLS